ncbi:MAG: HD domain-containing protein [Pricia sp.]|nr:HD domain-containing protein [Pricia sp.]
MKKILQKAQKHCLKLLANSRCKNLPFHNEKHTIEVYENVLKIGIYENKDLQELEPVLLAALFHDTGNGFVFEGHERYSVIEAGNFLRSKNYPAAKIAEVVVCINATQLSKRPDTINEKIICDADMFHLGTPSYRSKNELLRNEWANFRNIIYSDSEWHKLNLHFLRQHRFYTQYGTKILEPQKQKNQKELNDLVQQSN